METEIMLTTFDNPFDPFDEFVPWFLFDVEKGYNTCSRLARIAHSFEGMSTIEDKRETERAIDEIIKYDFLNIYKKVTRDTSSNTDLAPETDANNEKETEEDENIN